MVICLTLSGCLTLKYEETKASSIAGQGLASIRGSQEKVKAKFVGPRVVRYLVSEVDDPGATAKRADEILPLTPGQRRVKATAYIQIPRFGGFDLYLFQTDLSFAAAAGRRYEVRGHGDEAHAALGVYDMDEGRLVSQEVQGAPVISTSQRAPLIIFIP